MGNIQKDGRNLTVKLRKLLKEKKDVRILLVRTDRIGDVVLTIPLVKILRESFPGSYLAFMVRPYTSSLVEGNPYLDEVLIYDKDKTHKSVWGSFVFLIKVLMKKKFDLALILHPVNRVHLLCFFAGIPYKVGFDIKAGVLNNIKIHHVKQLGQKHELEYNLEFLDVLGIEKKDIEFYIPLKQEREDRVEKMFGESGITAEDTVVGINPTASCFSKIWPPEYFVSLIDKLLAKGCKIVLVGSGDKKEVVMKLRSSMKREVLDLIGKTDISTLASVLKRVKFFISCDSGPVHIANALGKRCIVIFGRNQPGLSFRRWGPYGKDHVVFHKDVGCKVCYAHNCTKDFECIRSISVEEVFKAALALIES